MSYNLDTSEVTYGPVVILPKTQFVTSPAVFNIPGSSGGGHTGFDQPSAMFLSTNIVSQSNLSYSVAAIANTENQVNLGGGHIEINMCFFQDNAAVGISTVTTFDGGNTDHNMLALNYSGLVYNSNTPLELRIFGTGSSGDVNINIGSLNTLYNLS